MSAQHLPACVAVQQLTEIQKAGLLLNTRLALIDDGLYGEDVENYIDDDLKTPGLLKEDMAKALLATSRNVSGERLLANAQQDFQAALQLDPLDIQVPSRVRSTEIRFAIDPACQRTPPEIWERIAAHLPRHHLRTLLFVSDFYRDIASRVIFHTIDMYFGDGQDKRGMEIFDRAMYDTDFASKVQSLRLHWAYEERDMMDLMIHIFKRSLPKFKALRHFEWIGYPEMPEEIVQVLLTTHKHLHGLGLFGWEFTAVGVSGFDNLRKFTLHMADYDGEGDATEILTVLDRNERTLKHLVLGGGLVLNQSWAFAFESVTINNLVHLDLVDTRISDFVLTRIAHVHKLQSLTLHGFFEDPKSASMVFASDHIIDCKHTLFPDLEAFRLVLEDRDDEAALYDSVTRFLQKREKLQRLDLGSCPWDKVQGILPDLRNLRVLGVRIDYLSQVVVNSLVKSIPTPMAAISLSVGDSARPLDEYAHCFTRFTTLSFLHLSSKLPNRNCMSENDIQVQMDKSARTIVAAVPSLDILASHRVLYVVVGSHGDTDPTASVELKEFAMDRWRRVDVGGEDAAWLVKKEVPIRFWG